VIYDVGARDGSINRKIGKLKRPSLAEREAAKKINEEINKETEQRIAARREKWNL
jgi:hypothetical protein